MPTNTHDVVVIGGGPAGLQAALTLARVHRDVVVVDADQPRNARAAHMHNLITYDGASPREFREHARRDLAAYDTASLLDDSVREVEDADDGDGFVVRTESGTELRGRCIILATGMRDDDHLTRLLAPIAGEVVVVDDLRKVVERDGRVEAHFGDAETTVLDGLFITTELFPAAPHAEQLGLERLKSGAVEIDLLGRTSRPGVLAAGDGAHHRDLPMPSGSVLAAAASGQVAAASCLTRLIEEAAEEGRPR